MNKQSLALLVLCIIGATTAFDFNFGNTNPIQCLVETQTTISSAKQLIAKINANTLEDQDVFDYGLDIYNDVYDILRDCTGQTGNFQQIEKTPELQECFSDADGLFHSLKSFIQAVSDVNVNAILSNGFSFYTQMVQATQICQSATLHPLSSTGFFDCFNNGRDFYSQVEGFMGSLASLQLPSVVYRAYNIIQSLQPLVNSCGIDADLNIPDIKFPDLSACVVDTSSLGDLIDQITNDFRQLDIKRLIDGIEQIGGQLQNISIECNPLTYTLQAASTQRNPILCLKQTVAMKKNIDSLQIEYNQNDIPDLVVTGYSILENLQSLLNVCQDTPIDLHIPEISFVNLHDCVSNSQDVVRDLKQITNDFKQKNWPNLIESAKAVSDSFKTVKIDCSKEQQFRI